MVMKSREPFQLKHPMMVYNFCLVILNAYIFYEVSFQKSSGWINMHFHLSVLKKKANYRNRLFTVFLTFSLLLILSVFLQ